MAKLSLSCLSLITAVTCSWAALFLNYEEDLRAGIPFGEDFHGEINSIGGSVRQVFSDKKGDRFILYLLAEAEHNFSENMIHQFYGKYKGPMGKWNISLGRVPLPQGLLTEWSPERMPYSSPYRLSGIIKSDNGILLNGTVGMFDYGIAATQGFGMEKMESFPGPGLLTARFGISPLLSGDMILGVSASYGTSYRSTMGHGNESEPVEHLTGTFDLTAYIGRGTIRMEAGGEKIENEWEARGFLESEYQLFPKLALLGAGNLYSHDSDIMGTIFAGVSARLKSVTIRGGYEYEKNMEEKQTVVIQLHRQFAYNR